MKIERASIRTSLKRLPWPGFDSMVKALQICVGDRYGDLTIVKELPAEGLARYKRRIFLMRCDCGETRKTQLDKLRTGRVKSCHECSIRRVRELNTVHGMRRSAEYGIWTAMLARCKNPNSSCFHSYGGRGVTVCDRWDPSKGGSFANFIADMGARPADDYQLDKEAVDPANTVYCPEMVRWVPRKANMRHTSRSRFLTYQGRTMLLSEWAVELGIGVSCLHRRIYKSGWTLERAFSTPPGEWRTT
jgi:hypothetical protein